MEETLEPSMCNGFGYINESYCFLDEIEANQEEVAVINYSETLCRIEPHFRLSLFFFLKTVYKIKCTCMEPAIHTDMVYQCTGS